jgi:hypothetical protein
MVCFILNSLFGTNANGEVDRTAVWTGVAAFAAIGAIFVAWIELGGAAKTTRADFAKRFVDSFFTKETRGLFTLLMNSALEFKILEIKGKNGKKIDELPIFEIKKDITDQLKGVVDVGSGKIGYSAFEIDDLLLGHFDDIGWYESRDLIELETIREMFGYYIYWCYKNEEIQKYLQDDCNAGKYEHFKRLGKLIGDNPRP